MMGAKPVLRPQAAKRPSLPSYAAPPVNEVVVGLIFEPVLSMRIPHTGLFWSRVKDKFPKCEHAPPFVLENNAWKDQSSGLPLPRVWFLGPNEDELIQLQNDRIYFNWRQTEKEEIYPRFGVVRGRFEEVVKEFDKFLGELFGATLVPRSCELSYINVIRKGHGWSSAGDLGDLFTDFQWVKREDRFLPTPNLSNWAASFDIPNGLGKLDVQAQFGKKKADQAEIIRLELTARGLGEQKDLAAAWRWYDTGHEWIVKGFADLTQMDIQKTYWKRAE